MSTDALTTLALGNDCEHYLLTGGDDRLVAQQRALIVTNCSMQNTRALDPEAVRWRFPRYVAPVAGASFYFDIDANGDILEIQTAECATPFQLVTAQDATREFFREKLHGQVRLGACGYARSQSQLARLKFTGSHLNVSLNTPDLQGYRTALENSGAREAAMFFLATSQVFGGIGTAFAPEWEVRSRVIVQDISNDCIQTKGLLQPGRDVPSYEVKEIETFHYTHFEAGWARSAFQRALSASCVAIDAHLACHHTGDVLSALTRHGIPSTPSEGWYRTRQALSRCLGRRTHSPVRIGERDWTLLELLELRLHIYDRLLTDSEKTQVEWVSWTLQQLRALCSALAEYPGKVSGPLLGLDAIVKYEIVFLPFARRLGHDLDELCPYGANAAPATPELQEARDAMLGLNLLYHDWSMPRGLYEEVLEAYPDIARWHRVPQVDAIRTQQAPPTRAQRRQQLMDLYARISAASNSALTPGFAGFNRIGLRIQRNGHESLHMHSLPDVLSPEVTTEDRALVRRFAGMVGVDPDALPSAARA